MTLQRTVEGSVVAEGVALHCGEHSRVCIEPAPVNTGVVFVVGGVEIAALVDHVVDTQLATTLGIGSTRVRTVEHLLSALHGIGVDNAHIVVDGPEIPILDGSAAEWVSRIQAVGIADQSEPARMLRMVRPVEVKHGNRCARLEPGIGFSADLTIDFEHRSVGRQRLELAVDPAAYARELMWARTFGFARLVPAMQRMGLVRGGSLDNAVVFDEDGPINEGGLLSPNEPVRHKMLDAIGDVALLGHRIEGRLVAERPGHGLIVALARAVHDSPSAWEIRPAQA